MKLNDKKDIDSLMKVSVSSSKIDEATLKRIQDLAQLQNNMADFLIDRFNHNIQAFKKYLPDIANTFEKYKPTRSLEFFCLENGVPNLMFVDTQEIFYKAEDPSVLCRNQVKEALKTVPVKQIRYKKEYDAVGQIHIRYINEMTALLEQAGKEEGLTAEKMGVLANCVVLGVGLGYHLGNLYESVEIANCVIIEPDEDLFFASLHTFDWANLLEYLVESHHGIYLEIGVTADKLYADLNGFYSKRGRFLSSFWWNFVHYSSEKINALAKVLVADNYLNYSAFGFFDDHLFGNSHGIQAILKKSHFIRSDIELPERWINAPVFVIGNGPSLDQDIHFLRKNQDKAIIIACGTALDTLYHAGIQPDFYGCTERTIQIAQSIKMIPDRDFLDKIILLASDVVHPDTVDCFKNSALLFKADEPFFWLARLKLKGTAEKIRFILMMNPLVGNLGTSAVIAMKMKNAYLFGFDNGKKVGTENMHSQFSELYNQNKHFEKGGSYIIEDLVPGNFGGECISGNFYKLSIRNMEQMFELFKNTSHFCNCSDGALIKGTTPVHSYDLKFEELPVLDKKALHDFINNEYTTALDFTREQIIEQINIEKFSECLKHLKEIFSNRPESRIEFIDRMQTSSEYLYKLGFIENEKFICCNIEGSIQTVFLCLLYALYHNSDENICLKLANKIVDLYFHYLDDADILYSLQPDFIYGRQQKFLNGKVGRDYEDSKAPSLPNIPTLVDNSKYVDKQKKFVKLYD